LPEQQLMQTSVSVLLPPPVEERIVPSAWVKTYANALVVFSLSLAFAFAAWVYLNRRHSVIMASQTLFLGLIACGSVLSILAIVPMASDDTYDTEGLARTGEYVPANVACMSQVWLYSLGFTCSMGPLFAKTFRLSKLANTKLRRATMSNAQVLKYCAALVAVDLVLLIAWTAASPLKYFRDTQVTDAVGYPLVSVGLCRSEGDATPFVVLLGAFHLTVLLVGNYVCYTVRHLKKTVLSEGKYVSLAMFSNVQVLLLGIPLIVIASEDPTTSVFSRATVIFLIEVSTLLLIFIPKIIAWWTNADIMSGINGASGSGSSTKDTKDISMAPIADYVSSVHSYSDSGIHSSDYSVSVVIPPGKPPVAPAPLL
jgi:hypothetical protein